MYTVKDGSVTNLSEKFGNFVCDLSTEPISIISIIMHLTNMCRNISVLDTYTSFLPNLFIYAVFLLLTVICNIYMGNIVCICRNISSDKYGTFFIFSVKLTLSMQIIGFSVRLSSSLLWIQIYRLGVSHLDTTIPREADYDVRTSFLSPVTPAAARQSSGSDEVLGGSIYDPAYYSSLFEDGEENRVSVMLSMDRSFHSVDGQNHSISGSLSTSADASPLKLSLGRSIDALLVHDWILVIAGGQYKQPASAISSMNMTIRFFGLFLFCSSGVYSTAYSRLRGSRLCTEQLQ
ncbi:hypothetical protein F8388_003541 [Cannabis sativa]|uniref:Uncharacterized protein n=1 Tax=Cannabis sativa TaxID=3483 RepID=A0A7J6EM86_CANSA|nr:hypothetical protein F8388_003541 [Cannabis sativa]